MRPLHVNLVIALVCLAALPTIAQDEAPTADPMTPAQVLVTDPVATPTSGIANCVLWLDADDAATVFGRWKLVREDDEPHGLFTLVMRRFDEGWRIVHDHTSSAKP